MGSTNSRTSLHCENVTSAQRVVYCFALWTEYSWPQSDLCLTNLSDFKSKIQSIVDIYLVFNL